MQLDPSASPTRIHYRPIRERGSGALPFHTLEKMDHPHGNLEEIYDDNVNDKPAHSSSMVSYRAKGINKFTPVNLRLLGSNRIERIFLLAALVSTGSPTARQVAVQHPFRGDVSPLHPTPKAARF